MSFSVSLGRLRFSGGQEIPVERGQVLTLVGPNNCGKSTTLREILQSLENPNARAKVVTSVELDRDGDQGEFVGWLERSTRADDENGRRIFRGLGAQLEENEARNLWQQPRTQNLTRFFVRLLDAASRLSVVNTAQQIDLIKSHPTHPLHLLCLDDALEARFSTYFYKAFGTHLTLDRGAGTTLPLFCGRVQREPTEDRISTSYRKRLTQLPMLEQQGDGMRSFAGCLLEAVVAHHPIVLVDEPEAFLHPPQAQLLGTILGGASGPEKQLVIATHDSNLLRGLLNAASSNLKIVRLVREGNINRAFELNPAAIQELWSDPLLRFSNVLDGLFHETAVECEADSDCRFYSAVLEATRAGDPSAAGTEPMRLPDVLFTSCGGKHKMPAVLRALRGVGVKTRAVADFDVFRDEQPLRAIVEAVGGNWAEMENDWRTLKKALEAPRPALLAREARALIDEALASNQGDALTDGVAERIRAATKRPTIWDEAKKGGLSAVPSGQATAAAQSLIARLNAFGVFVVEVGELERFAPAIPDHGPAWVLEVLKSDLRADPALANARSFVERIVPP